MQIWQIKALELEASVLKHLVGFIHEYALYFLMGAVYLLLAFLVWVLCGGNVAEGRTTHRLRPPCPLYPSAGTAATATGNIRPISATAPVGPLRLR